LLVTAPSVGDVTVAEPQASVAAADPNALVILLAAGLHPNGTVVNVLVKVGGVLSSVHVTVRHADAVLLHPSVAMNILFCERLHPLLVTLPSGGDVTVAAPQASVADADPNAPVISLARGLHPNVTVVKLLVKPGGSRSTFQVTILDIVADLPHPSVPVNVLVCEREQLLLLMLPSLCCVMDAVLHPSVAVALPNAVVISLVRGLHPSGTSA